MIPPVSPLRPRPLEVYFQRSLLVLEDDPSLRDLVCEIAGGLGWKTECLGDFFAPQDQLYQGHFDCIVSHVSLKRRQITPLLRFMSEWRIWVPLVIIGRDKRTNDAAAEIAFRMGLGVCYPLETPLDSGLLRGRLARIDERLSDGFEGCCSRDCHWGNPLSASR